MAILPKIEMTVTKEFLKDLGFSLREGKRNGAYEILEIWDLTWNNLKVTIQIVLAEKIVGREEHYYDTLHFHGSIFLGNKNYGTTQILHYDIIDNTPRALTSTLFKVIGEASRAMLQWDLRRLLAIETERAR